MKENQFYANGRVAVLSTKLLGQDKLTRLAECSTVAEALKILSESGYAQGMTVSNPNDYEKILMAEFDRAIALLKELCYDKNAVGYFLCPYDYHNAKVLMKRKYMRVSGVEGCFENALDPVKMQQAFVVDDYSACSVNMAEGCDSVDKAFADGDRSPRTVDYFLDKAMFADMRRYANKSSINLVRQLYDWQVNTTNLMLLYRLKKASADKSSLDRWLVEGGSVSLQLLKNLWDNDGASMDLPDVYKTFYQFCTQNNENLVVAEAEQKKQRNRLLQQSADLTTIQPVLDYFFKKSDEIDKVRMLIIGIKSGADAESVRNILKD